MAIGWTGGAGSAGDVTYTGIAPSIATTVGEELDFRARRVGEWRIVTSAADYEFHYPAVGGVHTITAPTWQTNTVVLPAGRKVHTSGAGLLAGTLAVANQLVGDVADSLVSGDPFRVYSLGIVQLNPGGSGVDVTSTSGATCILRELIITAPAGTPIAPAGTIHDITATGSVVIEGIQVNAMTAGLVFDGVVGAARVFQATFSNMPSGARGFSVASTATVTIGVGWANCIFLTSFANQRLVYIDPAATIPGTPVTLPATSVGMRVTNCSIAIAGGTGRVVDETGIAEDDIRVLATTNLFGRRSEFLGVATFFDTSTPILNTYAVINTFEPIPFDNGGGGQINLSADSQRFTLVKNAGTDWYLRFDGPLEDLSAQVHVSLSYAATSTGSNLSVRLEQRLTTGGGWTAIDGSTTLVRQTNGLNRHVDVSGFTVLQRDLHFRVTIANDNTSATTDIFSVSIDVEGAV
jgi:hypothetical protein